MLHLGKIPNTAESELESYILRLLKVCFLSHPRGLLFDNIEYLCSVFENRRGKGDQGKICTEDGGERSPGEIQEPQSVTCGAHGSLRSD